MSWSSARGPASSPSLSCTPARRSRRSSPSRRCAPRWCATAPRSGFSTARRTEIFDRLAGEGAPRYRSGRWREPLQRSELFGPLHHRLAYHVHHVTPEAFMDRMLSVSYVAAASEDERARVRAEVEELIATDPELGGDE